MGCQIMHYSVLWVANYQTLRILGLNCSAHFVHIVKMNYHRGEAAYCDHFETKYSEYFNRMIKIADEVIETSQI